MKNAFVIVTLSGLMSACALAPQTTPLAGSAGKAGAGDASTPVASPGSAAAGDGSGGSAEAEVDADRPETLDPCLPKVALTSALMYQLMKAELEIGRGEWESPYKILLAVATETRDPRLAQRAADVALANKQPVESMRAVSLWRELAPESDEANQYFVGLVTLSDNIAPAEPILQKRLAAAPAASRALLMFQTQQLLAQASDKVAASAMLARLLKPYGQSAEAHVLLAQNAFANGATAEAQQEAQTALSLQRDSEVAVLTLAQVLQDEAKASAVLAQFLKTHPEARDVRAARARLLVNQGQFEPARGEFLTLLKGQPDNLATLYALAIVSMQLNDNAGAERYLVHFMDAIESNPGEERDPAKVLMLLSQLAQERGDTKAALAWLAKVEESDQNAWFGAQLRRAQLLGKQGDVDGARALLATLKPTEPAAQARVLIAEGQVLRDADRTEEAYRLMTDAVRRFPADPDLLYDYALLAEKSGHFDVMETSLRQVMAQAPDNRHAYNALGYSLAERNERLPEALALIEKALKMAPDDPFIMDSMGWVQFRLGNLDAAEAELRRAYTLRNDPEIAVHLGEVLWSRGKQADAQKLWREARAKDPKNDSLRSTLARLHLSL